MKRLLIAIPLLALAVGALLFLRPQPGIQTAPVVIPGKHVDGHEQVPGSPTNPVKPSPAAPAQTGNIHLLVQSQGKGLPRVRVKVAPENGPGGMTVQTDDNGFQTLLQVPVGEYSVEASVPRHVPAHVHVVVTANQTSEITLPLSPGSRLEGTVVDALGQPVAGARLNLLNPPKGIMSSPGLAAESNAEGRFVIDGIPLADLDLHAYHAQFKPWLKRDLPFRSADVVLTETVVMQEGARVSGRVVNNAGLPVVKALVIANNGVPRGEETDREGKFVIFGLAESPLTLTVKAKGFGTQVKQAVPPNGEPLELRLGPAVRLAGTLDASPAPDLFQISLYRFDPAQGKEARIEVRPFSGTKGSFEFADLEPGTYRLEAAAQGFASSDQPQVVVQEGAETPPVRIKLVPRK